MPKRVPLQSVVVKRDGASTIPMIGQPFEFTEQEVAEIEATNPDALTAEVVVDMAKEEKKSSKKGEDL